jgi:hypothetical protein
MKRTKSRGACRVWRESLRTFPSPSASVNLPISAGVVRPGTLSHIPGARGGGRPSAGISPLKCNSWHFRARAGGTERSTIYSGSNVVTAAATRSSHERRMRRTPPFNSPSVANGRTLKVSLGVARRVAPSTSLTRLLRSRPGTPRLSQSQISCASPRHAARRYSCPFITIEVITHNRRRATAAIARLRPRRSASDSKMRRQRASRRTSCQAAWQSIQRRSREPVCVMPKFVPSAGRFADRRRQTCVGDDALL